MEKETKLIYIYPVADEQVKWGNDDPRGILNPENTYTLLKKEEHSYHTKYILKEFPDKKFNSVHFAEI
jgi:hypothetical protein